MMEIIDSIGALLALFGALLMSYQSVFAVIGFFGKAKAFPKTEKIHKFAIVIAARNESSVIGNLLESIAEQDYDKDCVKVFAVADNCSDNTAEICRSYGATVYERNDPMRARKGYALQFLFENIDRDFGIEAYDGYLFFDADNLLAPDFLSRINEAFATGCDAAVGYRNTKNFSDNIVSSAYGIHFCRSSTLMHRPRALLGLPTHIAGTGYVLRSHLLRDGWKYTTLTEDTQFTLESVASGLHIEFCEAAEFFDEQPTKFSVMLRQRLRWAKGRLVCFFLTAMKLIKGLFCRDGAKKRAACYDMFFYSFPKALLSCIFTAAIGIISFIVGEVTANERGIAGIFLGLAVSLASTYLGFVTVGAITVIRERSHIHCKTSRLVLYVLAFPWFDIVGLPIAVMSLFIRVKWKPIIHHRAVKISEITDGLTK